jgi:hypothetical protein
MLWQSRGDRAWLRRIATLIATTEALDAAVTLVRCGNAAVALPRRSSARRSRRRRCSSPCAWRRPVGERVADRVSVNRLLVTRPEAPLKSQRSSATWGTTQVRAEHRVHHAYTTEAVGSAVAGCCRTRDLACIRVLCPVKLHRATSVGGLWLRRSRVRAPSVTPKASPWGRVRRSQIVSLGRVSGALLMRSVMRCCVARGLERSGTRSRWTCTIESASKFAVSIARSLV